MATPQIADGPDGLRALVGRELGPSDWLTITQDLVDRFAEATGDRQWIHVDRARASESPFGGLIAHGYLTLSLLPTIVPQIITLAGFSSAVNYGTDKVRFPSPVLVGSRVRGTMVVEAVTDVPGGVQLNATVTVRAEGAPKPACVASSITRHYP